MVHFFLTEELLAKWRMPSPTVLYEVSTDLSQLQKYNNIRLKTVIQTLSSSSFVSPLIMDAVFFESWCFNKLRISNSYQNQTRFCRLTMTLSWTQPSFRFQKVIFLRMYYLNTFFLDSFGFGQHTVGLILKALDPMFKMSSINRPS